MSKNSKEFDYEFVDASSMAFVHKKIIYDDCGFVKDFVVLHVNKAFEDLLKVNANDVKGIYESNFFGYARDYYQNLLKDYTPFFKKKKEFAVDIYSPKYHKWLRIKYEHVRDEHYFSWVLNVNGEKVLMQTSNEMFQTGTINSKLIAERACRISESSYVLFCTFKEDSPCISESEDYFESESLDQLSIDLKEYFSKINKEKINQSLSTNLPFQIGNSRLSLAVPDPYNYKIHVLKTENLIEGLFLFLYQKESVLSDELFLMTFMEQTSILIHGKDLLDKRKRAEEISMEKEKKYRIMSDNTTDGIAMIKNTKVEYISPSYKKMLALDKDYTVNTFSEAMKNVPEAYIAKMNELFDNAVKTHQETIKYRYPVNRPNEQQIWIEDNLKLIWNDDNNLINTYVNGRDVTEQVLNENELKEAQQRVENANKAKTEFMMNMSHELRTPLNGIIGFSNILRGTNLDKDQMDYLTNIIVSGIRLLDIVNDILDFSKIETYKMTLKYEAVSLKKMLENLMNLINSHAEKKKISTELIVDEDVPEFIMTDPMKLSQILGNLLMNSLKFTKEGKITLKVQLFAKNTSQAVVKFSVNDTGVGIIESMKKKIFDSFTQADSTITREYGGTGLGLSISNGILKLMGSRLNLSSAPLKGSEFSFILTLDICEKTDTRTIVSPVSKKEEYKRLKILIVEDNPINLKLNKLIIRRHYPYAKIIDACNGKDALKKYVEHKPDLILMDIRMPEMNGFEATELIKKSFKDREVIIIGLSAEAHKDKINEGISVGMDDYITKPVIPNELIKVINKYI